MGGRRQTSLKPGGREDGAGPLLAAALDRSSGVGCFRDHTAAGLVTVAELRERGGFGNSGLSPELSSGRNLETRGRPGTWTAVVGHEMNPNRFGC